MKKVWIIVIVIILLGAGAYLGRHKLKTMFMGSSQAPMTQTTTQMQTTPTTSPSTGNIYMTKTGAKGTYLTDFQGMTLYTFDKDTTGVSTCTGGCATTWPPYTSGATAQGTFPANITVIVRADGTKQFAWKGMPLYYFASDSKAGDMLGDGVGGLWHIVKP